MCIIMSAATTSPVNLNENGRAKLAPAADQMPTTAVNVSVWAEPRGDVCFVPSFPPPSVYQSEPARSSADYCLISAVIALRRKWQKTPILHAHSGTGPLP